MTDITTAARTKADEPAKPPLRQRIATRWDNLNPTTKAIMVTGLTVVAAGVVRAVAGGRAPADEPAHPIETEENTRQGRYDHLGRHVQLNNHGYYYMCQHYACSKKVNWTIPGHDCCGRCTPGRNCLKEAQRDYAGPGTHAHEFWETFMNPGVCATCGELPEVHPKP
ncbi:hypothetical protein [Streptomyces californicus]|uniref:hypothetical protein n=1 Tax=Streptomyces californicus TaxID=67351 RepID=UPI00067E0281|nr:hypothetical protein [Streptomyces californicus]QRV59519.1 hypothetical protein I6J40_35315 [Streptomyces californicus]